MYSDLYILYFFSNKLLIAVAKPRKVLQRAGEDIHFIISLNGCGTKVVVKGNPQSYKFTFSEVLI